MSLTLQACPVSPAVQLCLWNQTTITGFIQRPLIPVEDEVGMLLGFPGQIEKLGETICDIQCVLADGKRKQNKSSAIERWLVQLKDVMYDAIDVIDLCQIKAK